MGRLQTVVVGVGVDESVMPGPCDMKLFGHVTRSQRVITGYHNNLTAFNTQWQADQLSAVETPSLSLYTAVRRSSASAVANGYQCKQRQTNWFCGDFAA